MASDNSLLTIAVILVVLAGAAFYMTYNNQFRFQDVLLQPEGNVTVEIVTSLAIKVDPAIIDWGTGFVNTSTGASSAANLSSEGEYIDFIGGVQVINSNGFNVENTGNVNATINIATGKTNVTFIGGTGPDAIYRYKVTDCFVAGNCVAGGGAGLGVKGFEDTEPSCFTSSFTKATYTEVNTTGIGTEVCSQFGNVAKQNMFRIDVRVLIPANSVVEAKNDTMTITATAAP